jgi:hypothetical protein
MRSIDPCPLEPQTLAVQSPASLPYNALAFAAEDFKIGLRVPEERTTVERRPGIYSLKETRLAIMKTSLPALALLIGFGSPASAWEMTPLSRCFEAMEGGSVIRSFSNEDWFSPATRQYHLETEHIWVFYRGELFDLYYDTLGEGASAAYCEVKQFYPGEGQPY